MPSPLPEPMRVTQPDAVTLEKAGLSEYGLWRDSRGIPGRVQHHRPAEIFEGNKVLMDAIVGCFEIDRSKEDLERVTRTIVKKCNAEIHSQSAIEGTLELKHEAQCRQGGCGAGRDRDLRRGPEHNRRRRGRRQDLSTHEEQADHNLQYMVATAILDDQVMPEQYLAERIQRSDVQNLLWK